MAPILIDHRGLVKISFIFLSTAVFIFVSGFFSGYQRAAVIYQSGSEIATLALPEIVAGTAADIEPQRPEVIAVGEDIDVDSDRQMSAVTFEGNMESVKGKGASEKEKRTSESSLGQNNVINDKQVPSIAFDSEKLKRIKYSIQAGMYSRLVNAENMVNLLRAQQFDAYVSEHLNEKNEVLYNVRFGYYVDKKTAATALHEYKEKQNGDAYLVKFSLESVTSVAGVEDLKPSNNMEKSSKNLSPVTLPSEVSQEKISQLEMSKASSILTNNQTNIITN